VVVISQCHRALDCLININEDIFGCCDQGVLSLAREVDPLAARTIGVLTKPDQIEEGCHAQWLDVLEGRR
jgi:hypothetical protein